MNNKITVEGEYIHQDETGNTTADFTEVFILNGEVSTIPQARSVVSRLILPRLKKKNSDTQLILTCQVTEMKACMEKAEQVELTKLWLEAIELSCVPEGLSNTEEGKKKGLTRAIERCKVRNAKNAKKKTTDHASL